MAAGKISAFLKYYGELGYNAGQLKTSFIESPLLSGTNFYHLERIELADKEILLQLSLDYNHIPVRVASCSAYLVSSGEVVGAVLKELPKLEELIEILINRQQAIIYTSKPKIMNNENLEYLKNKIEKLGFGIGMHEDLSKKVTAGDKDIQLQNTVSSKNDNVTFTLDLRRSDSSDMYFLNRFHAELKNTQPEIQRSQSFPVYQQGNNYTAQEAFNLVAGRAVHKELFNQEGERRTEWLKTDFNKLDNYKNPTTQSYGEKYGYDVEKALAKFPIAEMENPAQKEKLISGLKAGNLESVTIFKDGKDSLFQVDANPHFRTLNIRDEEGNILKRDQYQKKSTDQSEKLDKAITENKSEAKTRSKSVSR